MPNFITNTAIVNESWNGRGLITHNGVTKALVRADDGTLWAAVRENHIKKPINIYRSRDGGFSWQNMWASDFQDNRFTAVAGLNQNGPYMHLTLSEERDRLILWHSYTGGADYNIEPFIFDISDAGLTRKTTSPDHAVTSITTDHDQLAFDISYDSTHIYMTYTYASMLKVQTYSHTSQSNFVAQHGTGSTYFNVFATHANDDNTLDILVLKDDSPSMSLQYLRWSAFGTFTTPTVITSFPAADVSDLNIERDGRGTLLAYWTQESADGTSIVLKYATSNGGVSWTINEVPFTTDQSSFVDIATGRLSGRTVALGGLQGFLLGYVRYNNGEPISYIRTLLWDDETDTYVLGDEKIAAHHSTGFRFFRPTGTQLIDLDQLGEVRIAYQLGNNTSTIQLNVEPVTFAQHLLREMEDFQTEDVAYFLDTPDEGQLLVSFNLLGALDENVDYFALGLTGAVTNKYLGAFNKVGSVLSFYRYEPTPAAETSDRSSYGAPMLTVAKAMIEPRSYDFPSAQGNESFTTYIERDQRKIHLPPNLHLGRTFTVNAGNHLKRTVWLVRFDGNEYEISQVVPRFLHDQIAYYEANAYVVGPSNDPFSRTILPSET